MGAVEDCVELYFRIGFTNKEILNLLAHQHHIIISIRTLKRICKKMHLFRRKNQTDLEEVAAFVEGEMAELVNCRVIGGCISGPFRGVSWCLKKQSD